MGFEKTLFAQILEESKEALDAFNLKSLTRDIRTRVTQPTLFDKPKISKIIKAGEKERNPF